MLSVGQIPDNFSITDVFQLDLAAAPTALVGRRALYTELIWDAEGGFQQEWIDGSSVQINMDTTVTFLLKRRAFSAQGLSLFTLGAGGGGAEYGLDLEGAETGAMVVGLRGYPLQNTGLPSDGEGWFWNTAAGEYQLAAGGGGGSGDVVGPASSTTGNFAVFDDTTGKLIEDAGFGPAEMQTAIESYADGGDATTLAAAEAYADALIVPKTFLADINFTQATPATLVDGANTVGGVPVTGVNIASGATSAAVGANGLRIVNSTANTDYWATVRTAPLFEWAMSDLDPEFSAATHELRIYGLLNSDGNANFENARLTLETQPATVNVRSFWSQALGYNSQIGVSSEQCRTTTVTQLQTQAGSQARKGLCLVRKATGEVYYYSKDLSSFSNTDTNDVVFGEELGSWTLDAVSSPSNTTLVAGSGTLVTNPASLKVLFSSQTVNTNGSHISDLKRLRIQAVKVDDQVTIAASDKAYYQGHNEGGTIPGTGALTFQNVVTFMTGGTYTDALQFNVSRSSGNFTVALTGIYQVHVQYNQFITASSARTLRCRKNGVTQLVTCGYTVASDGVTLQLTGLVSCTAADVLTFEIVMEANGTTFGTATLDGTTNRNLTVSIHKIA